MLVPKLLFWLKECLESSERKIFLVGKPGAQVLGSLKTYSPRHPPLLQVRCCVGQKVCSGFFIASLWEKPQANFLANPLFTPLLATCGFWVCGSERESKLPLSHHPSTPTVAPSSPNILTTWSPRVGKRSFDVYTWTACQDQRLLSVQWLIVFWYQGRLTPAPTGSRLWWSVYHVEALKDQCSGLCTPRITALTFWNSAFSSTVRMRKPASVGQRGLRWKWGWDYLPQEPTQLPVKSNVKSRDYWYEDNFACSERRHLLITSLLDEGYSFSLPAKDASSFLTGLRESVVIFIFTSQRCHKGGGLALLDMPLRHRHSNTISWCEMFSSLKTDAGTIKRDLNQARKTRCSCLVQPLTSLAKSLNTPLDLIFPYL